MELKLCGITNLADARFAAAAGFDYLGFIQFSGSARYVEASSAKEIIEWVSGPKSVGVFVDETSEHINRVADHAGFDLVQLHGTESVDVCEAIDLPVMKAVRVSENDDLTSLRSRMNPFEDAVDYFLFDTHHGHLHGGTGVTFDWALATELAQEFRIFLAGGITPENVVEAGESVRPHGIDISSGLESEPGIKDFSKIETLMSVLRGSGLIAGTV